MRAALTPLLAVLCAVLAALTGGCSLGFEEDQPVVDGKRRPLKVQHALGRETRVPYTAVSPAALDPAALETALALGVPAVAATSWAADGEFPAYLGGAVADLEPLGRPGAPDLDALEAADPDVIIGNQLYQPRLYDDLDAIAPTVMSGVPVSEWKADVRFFGEALGRPDEGEALLIDWDRRAARVRERIAHESIERVRLSPELAAALSPAFVRTVLEDVGLPASAATATGRGGGILSGRALLAAIEDSAQAPKGS